MKIGVFTVAFGDMKFEAMLDYVAGVGVEAVEIGTGNYPGRRALRYGQAARERGGAQEVPEGHRVARARHQRAVVPRQPAAPGQDSSPRRTTTSTARPSSSRRSSASSASSTSPAARAARRRDKYPELGHLPLADRFLGHPRTGSGTRSSSPTGRKRPSSPRSTASRSASRCTRTSWSTTPRPW